VVLQDLDRLDRGIIAALQVDGRRAYSRIADEVGVSESVIRYRVRRLEEAGVLRIVGIADPSRMGFDLMAIVGVKGVAGKIDDICGELERMPEASYVVVTAGAFDVFVELLCRDTAHFAVHSLVQWWLRQGRRRYPDADHLLILADNGGSNGSRTRAWKHQLQTEFCDRFHISVTVCHYPPGASKWNPVEHRLFSPVSRNWAACPLSSFETILNYIRTTKTRTGLRVTATLDPHAYATGVKITKAEMATVHLEPHATLPEWNYTLRPSVSA